MISAIKIDTSNLERAVRLMPDKLRSVLQDTDTQRQIADIMQQAILKNFISEGARIGSRWAELKPRYSIEKLKRWGNKQILEASGLGKNSLSVEVQGGIKISFDRVMIYHFSNEPRRGRLPQRDAIGFTSGDLQLIASIISRKYAGVSTNYFSIKK